MGNCYKAQQASEKSVACVVGKKRDEWLSLFADDAVVQDPVGVSPLDPTGLGHKGIKAITNFYDTVIATGNLTMEIINSHPAGDECANVVKLSNDMGNGKVLTTDMVAVYCANDEGKIISLKAYWEYSKIEEQLAQMG